MTQETLKELPKIELHCHLDGSLSRPFIEKRLGRTVRPEELSVSENCTSLNEYLEKYHDILMESVAETSEEFMDRYFEGDTFSVAEVSAAIATNVQDGSIVPVCMGSPVNLRGVSN